MANMVDILRFSLFSLIFTLVSGDLLATDPNYVSKVEQSMAHVIRDYLGDNPAEFGTLFKLVDQLEQRSQEHSVKSVTDPISLLRVVHGLLNEWKDIQKKLREISSEMKSTKKKDKLQLPKKQDVHEIVNVLFRIQDTYRLNAKEIAAGIAPGLGHTGSLSARECLDIGLSAFTKGDFYHALIWLQEAGARYENEPEPTISSPEVLAPLAVTLAEQGNNGHAVRAAVWSAELMDSGEGEKEEMIKKYPKLEKLIESGIHRRASLFREDLPVVKNERTDFETGDKIYMALCRGELPQKPIFTNPALTCHYERSRPYLRLLPAKVEKLNLEPPILAFRNIISDNEIKMIKNLVKDKLHQSRVEDGEQRVLSPEQRSSSTGYLSHKEHKVVSNIRKRVSAFTGLNMETAEEFQIARYAVGGHYGPHYDHATTRSRSKHGYHGSYDQSTGDRIATVMFYLSEPEHGGATVFPYSTVTVPATKGDAIFWYNILKSGKDDKNSIHAGCPVVSGDKWIANQWIKEGGQEFIRPCDLHENA